MAAQYKVQHSYHSVGVQLGPWRAGDVVELEDAVAEWVNRDSPGCLLAASAAPEATAPADEPVRQKPAGQNRQHRGGANRGS